MTSAPAMVDSPSWAHRDHLHAERVLTHGAGSCTVRAAYDQHAGHWRLQPELAAAAMAQLTCFSTADLSEVTPRADPAKPGPAGWPATTRRRPHLGRGGRGRISHRGAVPGRQRCRAGRGRPRVQNSHAACGRRGLSVRTASLGPARPDRAARRLAHPAGHRAVERRRGDRGPAQRLAALSARRSRRPNLGYPRLPGPDQFLPTHACSCGSGPTGAAARSAPSPCSPSAGAPHAPSPQDQRQLIAGADLSYELDAVFGSDQSCRSISRARPGAGRPGCCGAGPASCRCSRDNRLVWLAFRKRCCRAGPDWPGALGANRPARTTLAPWPGSPAPGRPRRRPAPTRSASAGTARAVLWRPAAG